ncbi:MAG TPA: GreA/GreB family elongation factor [Candidatus Eremiobacteraceae bacterium]
MSRAFVKERDGDSGDDELPEARVTGPNFVTPNGLADLQARLAAAQTQLDALRADAGKTSAKSTLARARADVTRLQRRIDAAVVVQPAAISDGEIALGARVTIEYADGKQQAFTIVGEDEADPVNGLVSWKSPLGEALLGKRDGDIARWIRPAGDVEVRIVSVA